MIDINNKQDLFERLSKLRADQQPVFGVMTPQHMVEHLIWGVTFSNGKFPQQQIVPDDMTIKLRPLLMYTVKPYPRGIKTPMLGDTPPPLKYADIPSAIEQLKQELIDFENFFKENTTAINPALGVLNYEEWIMVHNKHFTHHMGQFELV
jgi:hypothetical protein